MQGQKVLLSKKLPHPKFKFNLHVPSELVIANSLRNLTLIFNVILPGNLNDLWIYSPYSFSWTFLGGNTTVDQDPVWGVQGRSDTLNNPGGLRFSCVFASNDFLWLFGGSVSDGTQNTIISVQRND